jgi:hypothetical protein
LAIPRKGVSLESLTTAYIAPWKLNPEQQQHQSAPPQFRGPGVPSCANSTHAKKIHRSSSCTAGSLGHHHLAHRRRHHGAREVRSQSPPAAMDPQAYPGPSRTRNSRGHGTGLLQNCKTSSPPPQGMGAPPGEASAVAPVLPRVRRHGGGRAGCDYFLCSICVISSINFLS